MTNSTWFEFGADGMPYEDVLPRLGEYADPDHICATRYGALPRGHNHLQGKTRFIVFTPTNDDFEDFRAELEARVGG